jgi:phosphatidylinositol alpha-1,6-mannosyltransferase
MNVGFIIPSLKKPSGWRSYSIGLIEALRPSVQPTLFVAAREFELAHEAFPDLPVIALPSVQQNALQSPRGWLPLLSTFRHIEKLRLSLDLIHSLEAYPAGLIAHWIGRKLNIPHLLTAQGTYGVVWAISPLDRLFYQAVLKNAAMVCSGSNGTLQLMRQYFPQSLRGKEMRRIRNGNHFYQRVPPELANERQIPSTPTLLTVGDVKPRKGQHISLQAFAQVQHHFPQARYFIVGKCPPNAYTRQLQAFIQQHRLNNVTLTGVVSDQELASYYRQASVFLLTPQDGQGAERLHFEGFGLVYLEAGAYGLPVIATHSGGVADAVQHGETGFLLPQDDVEGIAQAAIQLLSDAALNRRMGQANRRWAETLTWQQCAEEYLHAYQDVMKR